MQIFGILNVTPDSFSDGNQYVDEHQIITHVEKLISDGVDVIDIGGESTRPGAEVVDVETELKRVVPVIKLIKENYDVLISIDTYKPKVAKVAIDLGVDYINDVRGSYCNPEMLDLIIASKVKYILMHNNPNFKENNLLGKAAVEQINIECKPAIDYLLANNYPMEKLILDPGIGFSKSPEQSLSIIANLDYYKLTNNYKTLLGASRKSSLQLASGIQLAKERDIPTVVTSLIARWANIDCIRVHNVLVNKQGLDTLGVLNEYRR